MEFTIKSGSPEKQRSACVVVGRVRQSQAVAVGGTDRPREQRLHQRNHPPRRHGGQARRDAAAAQRARHAGRPRAAGRPRQGARLPRPRVPLGDPLRGQAAERNRLLRGGRLPDRGKGQAARSGVARRARGGRGDGGRLPLRADEEPADRGAPAAAQAHAVGAAALRSRPPARRPPRGAWPSRTAWISRATSATCPATSARRPTSAERAQRARPTNFPTSRSRCSSARNARNSAWARSCR